MTRDVEPGTMLNAGGTVLTLSLTHPVWVRAYVDEKNLGQAQPGQEVLLYTDSRPDKPYHGKILIRNCNPYMAKSVLSRRALNSRRRPSRPRICAPIWSTVCALW